MDTLLADAEMDAASCIGVLSMDADSEVLDIFGPELVAAVKTQAELDAVGVAEFLRSSGILLPTETGGYCHLSLAPCVLLGLALAIRLRRWELNHIRVHVDAGLPTSAEVFDKVTQFLSGQALNQFVMQTSVQALRLYHESFVWSAPECDLGVDIAIIAQEDEQFLDALAEFLIQQVQ